MGIACSPIVETRFLGLAMSLLDFSPRIPLGTSRFSFQNQSPNTFLIYKSNTWPHQINGVQFVESIGLLTVIFTLPWLSPALWWQMIGINVTGHVTIALALIYG